MKERSRENSHIIHELSSNHDTGNQEPMRIEGADGQRGLALREPVKVDEGNNEARWAAIGILEDPLKVTLDGNVGPCEAMEG